MVKKIGSIRKAVYIILCSNVYLIHSINIMVQPNETKQTQPATVMSAIPAVPIPPQPPPAPPAEKSITIINASPFHMNVRFETNTNPGVVDGIPANGSKKINHKINSLIMYSFEQLPSKPITPDMIQGDVVTIKTPQELMPKPVQEPVAPPQIVQAVAPAIPTIPTSPSIVVPTQQLPASASSKGPPGYKEEVK